MINIQSLILSIVFLIVTILFYLLHKSWIKTAKSNSPEIKQFTKIKVFRGYVLIVAGAITSLIYFIKSFN